MYSIESLQTIALGKVSEAATYAWNREDFAEVAILVYSSIPDNDKGLRDIVTKVITEHANTLLKKTKVEGSVRGISGLAYDLLKAVSNESAADGPCCRVCGGSTAVWCSTCKNYHVSCSCWTSNRCRTCAASYGY